MPKTELEHFQHVEDVITFIKQRLPKEAGPEAWKNVCEDVLNCHLPVVEPMLKEALKDVKGHPSEENTIRGLLRAVSWYQHPQLSLEQLLKNIEKLSPIVSSEEQPYLQTIREILEQKKDGFDAYPAALAIETLLSAPSTTEHQTELIELRDQIYYQLLYPHWFEVMKQWTDRKTKTSL
jgi:hypothetical protein